MTELLIDINVTISLFITWYFRNINFSLYIYSQYAYLGTLYSIEQETKRFIDTNKTRHSDLLFLNCSLYFKLQLKTTNCEDLRCLDILF